MDDNTSLKQALQEQTANITALFKELLKQELTTYQAELIEYIDTKIEESMRITQAGFAEVATELQQARQDREDIRRQARSTKLEILDKLAPRHQVDNHERRLSALESS